MIYLNSELHLQNVRVAGIKGQEKIKQNYLARIDEYNKNPSLCLNCKISLDYKHRGNKFCGRSCSAQYNNKRRAPRTVESKLKTSKSIVLSHIKNNYIPKKLLGSDNGNWKGESKFHMVTCKICNNQFKTLISSSRKTCSEECKIAAIMDRTYQNGRKNIIYYNGIILDSSWELKLAIWLDENNIKWVRPKHLKWVDESGKSRLYFPDFYLEDFDLYVDPKNPYCLQLDEYKMKYFSSRINIIYGDIEMILQILQNMLI